MKIDDLKEIILKNSEDKTIEFKRLFHGRGNFYEGFEYLTVDSLDKILFASLFNELPQELEFELKNLLLEICDLKAYQTLVFQKRYLKDDSYEVLRGSLSENLTVIENNLKFNISFKNQNIGFFPDMKIGKEYIESISKDKNILNLFSYTCSFSLYALKGDAKQVVNVDMSKPSLNIGQKNHQINNLDTRKVKFLPFNILKSWSKIRKFAPYDIIIIDPPSFQKGSFAASKDYEKIIKKLDELASDNCIVLSCLNAPELDTGFMINLFKEFAPNFVYKKRLENLSTFPSINKEKSLKNLVFVKSKND